MLNISHAVFIISTILAIIIIVWNKNRCDINSLRQFLLNYLIHGVWYRKRKIYYSIIQNEIFFLHLTFPARYKFDFICLDTKRSSAIDCNMESWRTPSIDILIQGREREATRERERERMQNGSSTRGAYALVCVCEYPVWVHVCLGNVCVCIEVCISIPWKEVTASTLQHTIVNQFFRARRYIFLKLWARCTMLRESASGSDRYFSPLSVNPLINALFLSPPFPPQFLISQTFQLSLSHNPIINNIFLSF